MNKKCENCYYKDKCDLSDAMDENDVCDDYTPIGEEAEDEAVNELVEKRRSEFREEWIQYIEDDDK